MKGLNNLRVLLIRKRQLPPLTTCQRRQQLFCDFRIRCNALWTFDCSFTHDQIFKTRIDVTVQNDQFIITVTCKAFHLFTFDLKGPFVFFNAVTVKDTHLNHSTVVTWFHAQRCITHIRRLFTEDRAKKFFFWCHWAFAFWCDFTHQNVTWLNISTDINDTRFIQVTKGFFTYVWNITRDFLWAQFRVACGNFEFFDVNGCEYVILCDAFGN